MDDEDEYVGLPFDPMAPYDADFFTWDCTQKLAEIPGDLIVGTPNFVCVPSGLMFDTISNSSGLVTLRITDTAGVERTYKITMTFATEIGQQISRSRSLRVCCR